MTLLFLALMCSLAHMYAADHPGIIPCAVFWAISVLVDVACLSYLRTLRSTLAWLVWLLSVLGGMMNAAVMLANGGFMPVIGGASSITPVYVTATDEHRLLWLADRRHWVGGSSPGDAALLLALVMALFLGLRLLWLPPKAVEQVS